MKKIITLLLAMVIAGTCLTACNGKDKQTGNGKGETTEVNSNQTDKTAETTKEEAETEETKNELFRSLSHRIFGDDTTIYLSVPDWPEVEKGYTTLFILDGIEYIAVTGNRDGENDESVISSLSTAHECAFDNFVGAIQNRSKVKSLTVTSESTETINGIEVYRYEGVLNVDDESMPEVYACGYSFVYEGIPCNITASVIDETQDQEMIDELKTLVEAMIPTIRTVE